MTNPPKNQITQLSKTLQEWLHEIESIHPLSMDLKMQRIQNVANRLNLIQPKSFVITVAGTNGKGSTATTIASLLQAIGLKVGLYTSPHMYRFNERIKINQIAINDLELINLFEQITKAKKEITLTYFEYATLAGLAYFKHHLCDVIVLEVGLGGRFDATNIIDANIAVITPIGIDHTQQLGDHIDKIAFEKAGIFRNQQTIILSESKPPLPLLEQALKHQARCLQRDRDFKILKQGLHQSTWNFELILNDEHYQFNHLHAPKLIGNHQYDNAACAITAVLASPFGTKLTPSCINQGLDDVNIEGRLEIHQRNMKTIQHTWGFDVTHNPHGAQTLAHWLNTQHFDQVHIIIGMLNDKDASGLAKILAPLVHSWSFVSLKGERGQTSFALYDKMRPFLIPNHNNITHFETILDACNSFYRINPALQINAQLSSNLDFALNSAILIIGSFHIVSDALAWYKGKNTHELTQ